jgi:hypothetical protein
VGVRLYDGGVEVRGDTAESGWCGGVEGDGEGSRRRDECWLLRVARALVPWLPL